MKERMIGLTDEQVIEFLNTNIELRKELIKQSGDCIYSGIDGRSILIYSPKDFKRISRLLNIPYTIKNLESEETSLKFEASFEYREFLVSAYLYEEGDLDE